MFKSGDLIRFNWHNPGEGNICKIKEVINDHFTLEDDLYYGHKYSLSIIRHASFEEIHGIVKQIKFWNNSYYEDYLNNKNIKPPFKIKNIFKIAKFYWRNI